MKNTIRLIIALMALAFVARGVAQQKERLLVILSEQHDKVRNQLLILQRAPLAGNEAKKQSAAVFKSFREAEKTLGELKKTVAARQRPGDDAHVKAIEKLYVQAGKQLAALDEELKKTAPDAAKIKSFILEVNDAMDKAERENRLMKVVPAIINTDKQISPLQN